MTGKPPTNEAMDIQPLVSLDERKLVDGDVDLEVFVRTTQQAAERLVWEEQALSRLHDSRVGVVMFGAAGSLVYAIVAITFLVTDIAGAGLAGITMCVFIVFTLLVLVAWRRVSSRT